MINDEFNTGSVLETSADLTEVQQKELDALPGLPLVIQALWNFKILLLFWQIYH